MLKKLITITLLVAITGILIWGGVNRTLARTSEDFSLSTEINGRGFNAKNTDNHGESKLEDHDESNLNILSQDGSGWQSNANQMGHDVDGETANNWEQGNNRDSTQGNNGVGRGNTSGKGSGQGSGYDTLDEAEIEALHLALDDEYHALAVYQTVIADFGEVAPFVEIAESENRHIEALLNQFTKHNLTPPENPWLGNVPGFDSFQAACQAGVEAELANIALYEQLFSMIDDPGLIQVFTNLSRASLESHLPEFQSCQ